MKTENLADYQIAANEAQSLFESLNITTQISAPLPDVREDWPNILYNVTFSKDGRNLTTEYRLGVGHVKWEMRGGSCFNFSQGHAIRNLTADEESLIHTAMSKPNAVFKNKQLHASAAAKLAQAQKVAPKPFEVLAAICGDGQSAHNDSFTNWADNFGMDSDSIKARGVYDHCGELYHKAVALIGAANVAKFAELHSQF